MILQLISAFIAIAAFAVFMSIPRKHIVWCGLLGAGCWLIYLLLEPIGIIIATFISTIFISLSSHILARILKSPVTVFLIPSIMALVPGAYLYRAAYHFFRGSGSLAVQQLTMTLEIAGAIAAAIFLTDSLFILLKRAAPKKECPTKRKAP